jgi:chemotaxis protein methyltransferase CheR
VKAAEGLDEVTLSQVEAVLRSACGLVLAQSVRRSLDRALARAAEARGLARETFLQRLLVRDSACVEAFIEYAVIGETYFFRHPEHLRELGRQASSGTRPFLVWSAGCASGEEPYTVAMTLLAAGLEPSEFRVLGTDVSARALERARMGSYTPWSVRRIEPELERRFLHPRGEAWAVVEQVQRTVEFRRHNLTTDPPPLPQVHAIFCRNVLIYFPPDLVRTVLERLVSALAPGGCLFLAPAEAPLAHGLGLEDYPVEGSVVFRRAVPSRQELPRAEPVRPPRPRRSSRALAPVRARPPAEPDSPAEPALPPLLVEAREAARHGQYERAEALAQQAARELWPEAYLLLAMVAEGRGDLSGAVGAVRKALYLEPKLAFAHAMLVSFYGQLGQREQAERARLNALRALEGVEDEHILRGVEAMTAGSLRRALVPSALAGKVGMA